MIALNIATGNNMTDYIISVLLKKKGNWNVIPDKHTQHESVWEEEERKKKHLSIDGVAFSSVYSNLTTYHKKKKLFFIVVAQNVCISFGVRWAVCIYRSI